MLRGQCDYPAYVSAACDDGCTGVLLDDLDALDGSIASLNLSGVVIAPYSQLMTLENQTREVKVSHMT